MTRRNNSWGLAVIWALGLGASLASAQAPTLPDTSPAASPGGGRSALGSAPGAAGTSFQVSPGTAEPILGGRTGPSVPRINPEAAPGRAPMNVPGQITIAPPPVLAPTELPTYGSLAIPAGPEDLGPPDGLTLDMAIERLVHFNIDLRSKFYEIPQAEADILTASLRNNPIFYADSQLIPYGQYSRERPGGPLQYDVNVSIPIDANNKRKARIDVATRAKRVLEAQYQDAVRLAIDNLYTAWVDVLAARETVRYSEISLRGYEQVLEPMKSKLETGDIEPAAYNRVAIQYDNALVGLRDARETLRRANRILGTLLNLPPAEAETIRIRGTIRDLVPPPPPEDQLIRLALGVRPDLVAYRLGVQRAISDVRLAEKNRLSDIYVLYQPYTFQNNTPFGTKSATSWALGVTVPLPILNRNQGNIRRAQINVQQTQTELAALERQAITDVQQAVKEYFLSRDAVAVLDRDLMPRAKAVLDSMEKRYEAQDISVIELLAARSEYNLTSRQYRDALVRHRRAMLDLNTAVGQRILP
ncbi:MAG: TolC family protein [Isosphaeraceae bacterium]|nr:TolC family protein [Isosphaeraceae bacterium]